METVKDFVQLGEQIRRIRQGRGLDQGQLAARCGLERTALSRAESGERKVSALEACEDRRGARRGPHRPRCASHAGRPGGAPAGRGGGDAK
ncbi:helix-turn-helix transcriptional regulator [Actinomyces timonensis]|uniref:Helix-turn-helix transcriptional regulator n=1 Tax=Actinomyces timonensis TaxID=1288391 RepID=A0AAU8N614_9ACTO